VGRDGNRLNAVQAHEELLLVPGSRADLLVQAGPGEAGHHFVLRTLPVQTGAAGDEYDGATLATVVVDGAPVSPLEMSSVTMSPLVDLRTLVTNSRGITFQQRSEEERFFINGQYFDGKKLHTRVKLGNVERWTIRNTTREWHVFHIHQVQFQVVEVDGKPVPFDGYRDVVNIHEKGSVTVIIPFDDQRTAGRYVYHCHILDHEDRGMMAMIQVGRDTTSVLAAMPMPMAHAVHAR
jgi:suppressor of ftsI